MSIGYVMAKNMYAATAMIWQGDISDLTVMVSQDMSLENY